MLLYTEINIHIRQKQSVGLKRISVNAFTQKAFSSSSPQHNTANKTTTTRLSAVVLCMLLFC